IRTKPRLVSDCSERRSGAEFFRNLLAANARNVMLRIRGPDVIGARADEAVVVKLLDYVRSPTADAGDREHRREHVHLDPQRLISGRSEEHTSELQSRFDLVCRL